MATTNPFLRELDIALALAREAGVIAVEIRDGGALGVELKPGDEPVTRADRAASELIVAGLAAAFPDDPIISEESPVPPGALAAHRHWFVDPIDGTKDFIRGSDGFSVMIGLVEAGRPVLGVVHQPTVARTFYTTAGGAMMEHEGTSTRLAVSSVRDVTAARLVASASHRSADIDRVKSTLGISDEHNIGSVGVKLALIAMGVRDLYINPQPKTKAWDTCGPEAILVAAGGRLTDLFGAPIEYTGELHHPRGLVASNGLIHDAVIAKIAPLFAALRS
ncbi:MAG: 3'(2'),5'-bisphosphate nucleotidase CysQ [Kofleriaceae bacterium]